MSKKVKIFVIVVGIIALLILIFSYVGNSAPAASTNGLSSTAGTVSAIPGGGSLVAPSQNNSSFSSLLSSINGITLDTSVFSSPAYQALRDNPVVLGTAIIGRQNPFAPIGADASNPQQAGGLQAQTLAPGKVTGTTAQFGALISASSPGPVTVVFNYGTSDSLTMASTPVTATKNGTALFTATGLTPSTAYYVEAVAVQGSVTATGTIMSFTTAAAQKQ